MAFTDPIATTAPPFTTAAGAHPIPLYNYFTYTSGEQLPTNAWWQNLLIPHVDSGNYNGKTATFPFAQWPAANGKGVLFAYHGTEGRSVASNAITLSAVTELSLEMNETVTTRQIPNYSDLGVSLLFNHSGGSMAINLVQGQAFHAATYTAATPVIRLEHAILQINGAAPVSSLTNVTKFKVTTSYHNREWLVYASQPISVSISGQVITATAPFTGTIQIAYLDAAEDEAVYDQASTSVLTGGSVNATFAGNTATVTFNFTSTGTGAPLVFALPHHQDMLSGASYTSISLLSMKGTMRALRAQTWTMTEQLTTITWNGSAPLPQSAAPDVLSAVAIEKDTTHDIVGNGWGVSPYYMGKYVAKMARMSLIAQEAGDTTSATEIINRLKDEVADYLTATPTGSPGVNGSGYVNTLVYQGGSTWKGISTQNGLNDMGADFGSGRFNDHHFHYGYWIYAAAVIARADPAWKAAHKDKIDALVRDIANPSTGDTYFPKFRHMDWFAGHSWAGGLVGIDVGPGQESTSEAINAWYGVYLWGLVNSSADMTNLGRLLLASEVRAAKRYWHIYDNSDIYEAPFNTNGTAVIVRTHKVAVETYFGSQPQYFYGIETLPFTPISELYIDQPWVQRSYAAASANIPISATGNPQDTGWNSVIRSFQAVIDPDAAYAYAQTITLEQIPEYESFVQFGRDLDNGLSKTNVLWWAATRSGFSGAEPVEPDPQPGAPTQSGTNANPVIYQPYVRGDTQTRAFTSVDGDYTVVPSDSVVAYTALTASSTVELPLTAPTGKIIIVKDQTGICGQGRTVTVQGSIDGTTSVVLSSPYAVLRLYSNGNGWSRISQ